MIQDDIVNSDEGIALSIWFSGCSRHCKGCHNPELWKNAPLENPLSIKDFLQAISANGIKRNLSFLGGEPFEGGNLSEMQGYIKAAKMVYPDIRILVWTGYTLEELKGLYKNKYLKQKMINEILDSIDVLIDGDYQEDKRNLKLFLRGSSNQRVLHKGVDF